MDYWLWMNIVRRALQPLSRWTTTWSQSPLSTHFLDVFPLLISRIIASLSHEWRLPPPLYSPFCWSERVNLLRLFRCSILLWIGDTCHILTALIRLLWLVNNNIWDLFLLNYHCSLRLPRMVSEEVFLFFVREQIFLNTFHTVVLFGGEIFKKGEKLSKLCIHFESTILEPGVQFTLIVWNNVRLSEKVVKQIVLQFTSQLLPSLNLG